jgi:hypothetical protein
MNPLLYKKVSVVAEAGVVLVYASGVFSNHDVVVALSTETARNLIADLDEAIGVAKLENEECRAARLQTEADSGLSEGPEE